MVSAALLATLATQDPVFVHSPTNEYTVREIGGFSVYISPASIKDEDALEPAVTLLNSKIEEINELVDPTILEDLHKVKIWLEHSNPRSRGAVYHPSRAWLKDNGYNTDKERSVEIGDLKNFVDWSDRTQPMMVLHELAHAYHHQVIGYANRRVRAAYQEARDGGEYEEITHVSGREQRHYGMNNVMEYFAEATEAYFGHNDFFPFNRAQLKDHDPALYSFLEFVWGRPRGQSMALGSSASEEVLKMLGRQKPMSSFFGSRYSAQK